jgi:hypothetical protein
MKGLHQVKQIRGRGMVKKGHDISMVSQKSLTPSDEDFISLSSDLDISTNILNNHFIVVASEQFNFPYSQNDSREIFVSDWDTLELDLHMNDNGSYLLRRYGVFEINQASLQITYQPNSTFYQSLETNPLNGGINRKFSELLKPTIENHFLHALMRLDFKSLPSSITCKIYFGELEFIKSKSCLIQVVQESPRLKEFTEMTKPLRFSTLFADIISILERTFFMERVKCHR